LETVRANLLALSSCVTGWCDCYKTVMNLEVQPLMTLRRQSWTEKES